MYQALYRKWRPSDFDEVSGQPHVTSTLKRELESGRISHAYLFTGSRGTGKTSCAKILAKAVNCLNPVNGNPCNKCEICRGISDGSIFDVIEIDAASNNGVDNIRDLREEANFTPVSAKYRVYIIDEVHMLSDSAFNALLKTLEEPPQHVVFILATTEVYKLPATVLSRCQRFDFKRISPEDITKRLLYVAEQEGAALDEDAAALIARIADGGMRDALSLLDRCCVKGENISIECVRDAAGIAGTEHLFDFSRCVAENDFSAALSLVTKLHNEACDIEGLCTELTLHFRNLMVAKTVSSFEGLVICSSNEAAMLRERSEKLRLSKILECLDALEQASAAMKGSINKKIRLEAAVVKMCTPVSLSPDEGGAVNPALEARVSAIEAKLSALSTGAAAPAAKPATEQKPALEQKPAPAPQEAPAPAAEPPAPAAPAPEFKNGPFNRWSEVLEVLKKYDMPLFGILAGSCASFVDGKLQITSDNPTLYDFICTETHGKDLKRSVFEVLGVNVRMSVAKPKKPEQDSKNPLENLKSKANVFNSEQN